METIIKKLMNEDMTRTEALMFMRKITVNRLSLLTTIINRNASVYERLIDDLETIDKMIAERSQYVKLRNVPNVDNNVYRQTTREYPVGKPYRFAQRFIETIIWILERVVKILVDIF